MTIYDRAPRRGTTLVEFALVFPILLLVLLGVIEFAWYARAQLTISNATREGARSASIGKTREEICKRVMGTASGIPVKTGDIALEYSTDSGTIYLPFPGDDSVKIPSQNGVPPGSLLRVTVEMAHQRLVDLPLTPQRIKVRVSMVRERT